MRHFQVDLVYNKRRIKALAVDFDMGFRDKPYNGIRDSLGSNITVEFVVPSSKRFEIWMARLRKAKEAKPLFLVIYGANYHGVAWTLSWEIIQRINGAVIGRLTMVFEGKVTRDGFRAKA